MLATSTRIRLLLLLVLLAGIGLFVSEQGYACAQKCSGSTGNCQTVEYVAGVCWETPTGCRVDWCVLPATGP